MKKKNRKKKKYAGTLGIALLQFCSGSMPSQKTAIGVLLLRRAGMNEFYVGLQYKKCCLC